MPSVYIKTYGCQMNERDSEAVAAQLVAKGYSLAPTEAVADVILLNTCSVRDAAEQKAIGKMQNLAAEVRKKAPELTGFDLQKTFKQPLKIGDSVQVDLVGNAKMEVRLNERTDEQGRMTITVKPPKLDEITYDGD